MEHVLGLIGKIFSSISNLLLGKRAEELDRRRDRDRKLYKAILELLPSEHIIPYYKKVDFGEGFSDSVFETLKKFQGFCEYPQNYFLNKKLENLKTHLLSSAQALLKGLRELTVPFDNPNTPFHSLPHNNLSYEEDFRLSKELGDLADKFVEDYTKFVVAAEKELS